MKSLILALLLTSTVVAQEPPYDYVFFENSLMPGGAFYSETAWHEQGWVENLAGKLPVTSERFHTPGNALVLHYTNGTRGWWSARVTHRPLRGRDDWDNGVNINTQNSPFRKPEALQMFVYSEQPVTADEVPRVQLGEDVELAMPAIPAGVWTRVVLPYRGELPKFMVFEQNGHDGKEHRLLVDDIGFVGQVAPAPLTPVHLTARAGERHVDLKWTPFSGPRRVQIERSLDGGEWIPVAVRVPEWGRYADWVGSPGRTASYRARAVGYDEAVGPPGEAVTAATRAFSEDELLTMVQEACFRYYWEGAEPNSGMALENRPGNPHMVATGASGFGIMALVVGTSRGFITREQAVQRFDRILTFLEKADHFHGAFAHYMDGRTGKVITFFGPTDNGGDLVETSFLMQGLLTARQFFDRPEEKALRDRITAQWEGVEWDWYRKGDFLVWHWSPDQGFVINHPLIGWNETMITYLLAIASPTHPVPPELYDTGWASQSKQAQEYRGWAQSKAGLLYGNGETFFGLKLDAALSNGGPLFFVHYSFMGNDPHGLADKWCPDYFVNNRNIALINQRYCEAAHYPRGSWGLTASDGPFSYSADEPVARMDIGKMTPTGAVASLPYTPAESMEALKHYYRDYGSFLWGEYGFRDAFDLEKDWCAELFMGLNQAPMTVMIENERTGLPWKLFMSNPEVQTMRRAIPR